MRVSACDNCSEPAKDESMTILLSGGQSIDLCFECSRAIRLLLEKHELIINTDVRKMIEQLS